MNVRCRSHHPEYSRFSKAVQLVLISSSLILAGCQRHGKNEKDEDERAGGGTSSHVSGGHLHSGGGSSKSTGIHSGGFGGTARGGFSGS